MESSNVATANLSTDLLKLRAGDGMQSSVVLTRAEALRLVELACLYSADARRLVAIVKNNDDPRPELRTLILSYNPPVENVLVGNDPNPFTDGFIAPASFTVPHVAEQFASMAVSNAADVCTLAAYVFKPELIHTLGSFFEAMIPQNALSRSSIVKAAPHYVALYAAVREGSAFPVVVTY